MIELHLIYLQDIYGALTVTPISSGYCLGSSNWLISCDHEKVAFVSGSSTLTTHPRPMEQATLKHANMLILTGLTQTPTANPDTMLGELCMTVGKFNRDSKHVEIPRCFHTILYFFIFIYLHLRRSNLSRHDFTKYYFVNYSGLDKLEIIVYFL